MKFPEDFNLPQFEELKRIQRQFQELAGPALAVGNLARDLTRQYAFLDTSGYRDLATELTAQHRQMTDLASEWTADHRQMTKVLATSFSGIVGEFQAIRSLAPERAYLEAIGPQLDAIRAPHLPFIEALQHELAQASRSRESFSDFQETFAGKVLTAAAEVAEAPEEERAEKATRLLDVLKSLGSKPPADRPRREGSLAIVLTVALWLEQKVASHHSEERTVSEIRASTSELAASISEHVDRSPVDLRVVSADVLNVRVGPTADARIVGRLATETLVRVLENRREWARIEYFDFVSAEIRTGWVALEFLERLPEALQK